MNRFLLQDIDFGGSIELRDKTFISQLLRVLRLNIWDSIIFFDWKIKKDYIYEISETTKKNILFKFIKEINNNSELEIDLTLYQSIPNKISKIEYIVQKATEVWFKKIIFFKAERSQKLNLSENKIERFKKIAIEATEQSNRNEILEIEFIESIDFQEIDWEVIFLHQEKNNDSSYIKDLQINHKNKINIFIWPEGGFSENEIESFTEKLKIKKVFLWNRILRTETAWVVVWFFIGQMSC